MDKILKYLFFLLLGFLSNFVQGQQPTAEADAIKAAWLAHFSQFITWPNINDTTNNFVIAVIGRDDLSGYLEKIYAKRKIKNKPVQLRYFTSTDSITHCHILFISPDMSTQIDKIL
ncbi:MAG: YfiR family protein, partial [Fulvivirga sp.]|nr:YfiR family protein [Fulvivirga sp.]